MEIIEKHELYNEIKLNTNTIKKIEKYIDKEAEKYYNSIELQKNKCPLSILPPNYSSNDMNQILKIKNAIVNGAAIFEIKDKELYNRMAKKSYTKNSEYALFYLNDKNKNIFICEKQDLIKSNFIKEIKIEKIKINDEKLNKRNANYEISEISNEEQDFVKELIQDDILMNEYSDSIVKNKLLFSNKEFCKININKKYKKELIRMLNLLNFKYIEIENSIYIDRKNKSKLSLNIEKCISGEFKNKPIYKQDLEVLNGTTKEKHIFVYENIEEKILNNLSENDIIKDEQKNHER